MSGETTDPAFVVLYGSESGCTVFYTPGIAAVHLVFQQWTSVEKDDCVEAFAIKMAQDRVCLSLGKLKTKTLYIAARNHAVVKVV